MDFTGSRQCHYCNNYFVKSAEKMKKHLSCSAGKAGFTLSFDNGKIIDYQDNYKNLGDVPFSIYFDFETTTGSVVFFDAKMFVVSYCMVVAFHPELDIPRICVFRSYDQSADQLTSLPHFEALQYNFFADTDHCNRVTLKQLEDAAFSVQYRKRNTALAEIFSVELKLTVDCLKFWFDKTHKINNLEVKLKDKLDFNQKHPKNSDTVCCLCDFPIEARAPNGWSHHVFRAERLFLENIYSEKQIRVMGIEKFEVYFKKLDRILGELETFSNSIEREVVNSLIKGQKDPEVEAITAKFKK